MLTDVVVVGAGGHAKVIVDAVRLGEPACCIAVVDQNPDKVGLMLLDPVVIQTWDKLKELPVKCHIAIGDNNNREQLSRLVCSFGKRLVSIVHPDATVSTYSKIGNGTFIAARVVIGPSAVLGESVIVNHGAVVDHDCHIDAFSHIAPNVTLGGGVVIGQRTFVGAGATILPLVKIGSNVTIGAGAVVLDNVPDNKTVIGVPGKVMCDEKC